MKLLWVVAFLTLFVQSAAAQSNPLSQDDSVLRWLDKNLGLWQKELNSIDVERLNIRFQEGKLIEESRNVCLEFLGERGNPKIMRIPERMRRLREAPTVGNRIMLGLVFERFDSCLDGLSSTVQSLTVTEGSNTWKIGNEWAKRLLDLRKEITPQTNTYWAIVLDSADRSCVAPSN